MSFFDKFTTKVKLSFFILSAFVLVQAALTLWVSSQSEYHIERSRISNKILTEFIDLGGNKQRLKVWLAQYLLTNDSSVEVRNNLIFKMNNSLVNLETLLNRDKQLSSKSAAETIIVNEQLQRTKTLNVNIKALEAEVSKISKKMYKNPGDAWVFMINVFDSLDGNDLRKVINDATEIQKIRAAEAETTAKNYIEYFNTSVYIITSIVLILSIFLLTQIQNSVRQPILNLVAAAKEFSRGNTQYRIKEISNNEFGMISAKINDMADELERTKVDEFKKRQVIELEVQDRTSALKNAVDQLQKSESERKIFLSNISHELKTPATAILGEASVTLRGADKDTATYKETLQNIQIIGRQLSNRIEDLLLLARTDSDVFRINLRTEDISALDTCLREALKISNPNLQHEFIVNLNLDTTQKLHFDYDRITQMLVILLDNSIRYSPVGEKSIVDIVNNENEIIISVSNKTDSLIDIDFTKVFERFYRSPIARVNKPDGLGIGLYLVQKIVQAHYGKVKAEPVENNMFKITITLPLESKA